MNNISAHKGPVMQTKLEQLERLCSEIPPAAP